MSIMWRDEAKARIWCREHSILFRLSDIDKTYEETANADKILDESYINIVNNDLPLDRIFCFKYEEDAVAFKLRWL